MDPRDTHKESHHRSLSYFCGSEDDTVHKSLPFYDVVDLILLEYCDVLLFVPRFRTPFVHGNSRVCGSSIQQCVVTVVFLPIQGPQSGVPLQLCFWSVGSPHVLRGVWLNPNRTGENRWTESSHFSIHSNFLLQMSPGTINSRFWVQLSVPIPASSWARPILILYILIPVILERIVHNLKIFIRYRSVPTKSYFTLFINKGPIMRILKSNWYIYLTSYQINLII